MQELADAFNATFENTKSVFLDLYGYDCPHLAPQNRKRVRTHFGKPYTQVIDAIAGSDLYIMNSTEEGFGLVLLEAMLNRVPWAARPIAGARRMADRGFTYTDISDLMKYLTSFVDKTKTTSWDRDTQLKLDDNRNFVLKSMSIRNTCDDIEVVLSQAQALVP